MGKAQHFGDTRAGESVRASCSRAGCICQPLQWAQRVGSRCAASLTPHLAGGWSRARSISRRWAAWLRTMTQAWRSLNLGNRSAIHTCCASADSITVQLPRSHLDARPNFPLCRTPTHCFRPPARGPAALTV